MNIKQIKTLDDVLKLFDIDKSRIIVDEEYMEEAKTPAPWAVHKEKRNLLIAGTYNEKWLHVIEAKDFFIFGYDSLGRAKQIDKATGQISEYKVLVT